MNDPIDEIGKDSLGGKNFVKKLDENGKFWNLKKYIFAPLKYIIFIHPEYFILSHPP